MYRASVGCGVRGGGEVADKDEAGDVVVVVVGGEEEEEVAGVGGEGPVGLAVGGDEHGGDERGGGLSG